MKNGLSKGFDRNTRSMEERVKIAGKMQALAAVALLGVGVVLAGCKSGPELTKDQAQALITAKYDAMAGAKLNIAVGDLAMQAAVRAGYLQGVKRYPNGYWADFKLSAAGAKELTVAGGELIQWRPTAPSDPHYAITMTTVAAPKLKARDFGDVTKVGEIATVVFTEDVNLSSLPAPVQEMARTPGNKMNDKKTATFALVNGAWAVQKID